MTNEEFDNLKEELMWEGSSVVMLSSDEQKFMEASLAYVRGKPIMTDAEYDALKLTLKGPCPACGTENISFFGTILTVSSGGPMNEVKCQNCSTALTYDSEKRLITLAKNKQEGSQAKSKKAATSASTS